VEIHQGDPIEDVYAWHLLHLDFKALIFQTHNLFLFRIEDEANREYIILSIDHITIYLHMLFLIKHSPNLDLLGDTYCLLQQKLSLPMLPQNIHQ